MSEADDVLRSIDQLRRDLSGYHGQLKAHNDLQTHCDNQRKRIGELEVLYAKVKAEAAGLRELVRDMWDGYNDPRCDECQLKDTPTCADCPICAREALVIDRMRELGIEVD